MIHDRPPLQTRPLRSPPLQSAELARHYTAFVRPGRILLTGHSHQAWPDASRAGVLAAWTAAAEHVDGKWGPVFEQVARVQGYIADLIGGRPEDIAIDQNTHALVSRFLSALPLHRGRPHVVTTDGEFHSMARQLRRLGEDGVEITWVPAAPVATLAARLAAAIRPDTAALMASTVLFQTATRVPDLKVAVAAAHAQGAAVLLDAYHGFGAMPFRLEDFGDDPIFVVSGGYKYAQWGEGVCWMRVPPDCPLRPIYTGWFSDFEHLSAPRTDGLIGYGSTGASRFAGSTFDPVSFYRAAAVIDFFEAQGLDMPRLRALSLTQTDRLIAGLDADFEVLTPRDHALRGGFVAVRIPGASAIVDALRRRGIFVDSRADVLRLGPAPYVTFDDIDVAVDHLRALCQARRGT